MFRLLVYAAASATVIAGAGSLVLFVLFAGARGLDLVDFRMDPVTALLWDALLCLVFFAQHSGMVHRPFRDFLARVLHPDYHGVLYTIASAAALVLLSVCWQPSHIVLVAATGPARWVTRVLLLIAAGIFVWAIRSLERFDAFGIDGLLSRIRHREATPRSLTIRGPYCWVRHPLYLAVILALWAAPVLTADALLLNILFTAWIVAGARLEERDLLRQFGRPYQEYQRQVPMLLPWPRRTASKRAASHV